MNNEELEQEIVMLKSGQKVNLAEIQNLIIRVNHPKIIDTLFITNYEEKLVFLIDRGFKPSQGIIDAIFGAEDFYKCRLLLEKDLEPSQGEIDRYFHQYNDLDYIYHIQFLHKLYLVND